jgi:hypothetical protein
MDWTARKWLVVIILLLVGIGVVATWLGVRAPRGLALLNNFPEFLKGLQNVEQRRIGQIILDSYNEYRSDARNWSLVAFGLLFLSAALSAFRGHFKVGVLAEE